MQFDGDILAKKWRHGALASAFKGLLVGAAVGVVCALALQAVVLPLFPTLVPTFAGFLTLTPGAATTAAATGALSWSAFSPIPFVVFNGIISSVIGSFTGGDAAVDAYKQQEVNHALERKVNELSAHQMERAASLSPKLAQIVSDGPRQAQGFAQAQEARAAAPTTHTLH